MSNPTELAEEAQSDQRGTEIFARYAFAPNALGYCGPPGASAMRRGSGVEVRSAARRFSGAWPYLQVLARMSGISDPLDHRLVESYWLGGGLGARLDPQEFGSELLAVIGPQAGSYWTHLTPELFAETSANHCFHVFGVYPWTRLLARGADGPALHVLDNCRISWGTVLSRDGSEADVWCRRLALGEVGLQLSDPAVFRVPVWVDGYSAVPHTAVGDTVALHWGQICGRLDARQVRDLEMSTQRQLQHTNRRLKRER
ncbi:MULTISPECIES: DUF6390 family protein [Pseudonocardia]|uniref:Uncharacterized protein n=2 Tax=Pseudonocardia TaxID=1847 RepID=A0A1Y2MHE3_PSEAH|nr:MULTISPECIES: DUF6390 family protein [Pseudonocardia]OSY34703.1 hypothetical protein BG845_06591 [Pseudonocardia autotrophica]TDN76397.1 hypothetical protein C8E95_5595 [Pseudonocardia autotrophica]BBG00387.1 hypothetical protein Pdca_15960 [Pseudonocardia autotrophica]GEC28432.1 hypothetical protein PSA01_54610 [Pseudonocardia saturnea]